ncbi:MAG: hypothetical protein QME78_15525 [Thermodesulfobacteriota bacterium]|nr:hypothetical protein [Thermodesulfobacteriota bacterium]
MRFTFVVAAYFVSTPHSSGFARLVRLRRRAFYFAIEILTFYEIIIFSSIYSEEALRPLRLCVKPEKQNVKPDPNPRNAEGKSICNKLFWSGRKEVEKGPVIGNAKN